MAGVTAVPKPGKKAEKIRESVEKAVKEPKAAKAPEEPKTVYSDTSIGTKKLKAAKTAAIALPGDRQMQIGKVPGIVSPTGLVLMQNISRDEWQEVINGVGTVRQWTAWAIGDAINFGERKFGEDIWQSLDSLSYSEQTLYNYTSVSNRVPLEIRRADLTWTHHEAVSKLKPEQQAIWLQRAVENDWSSRTLRDMIKESTGAKKDAAAKPAEPSSNGTGQTPIRGEVVTAEDGDSDEMAIGDGDQKFEMTPTERRAHALYQRLSALVVGFRPADVSVQDMADLLEDNVARVLRDALPTFGQYIVDLHDALTASLDAPAEDAEEEDEDDDVEESEDAADRVIEEVFEDEDDDE